MAYNLTNITDNADNIMQFGNEINNLTGGMFVNVTLLMIFIISFATTRHKDIRQSFFISSVVTLFAAIGFFFVGFMPMQNMLFPLLLIVISLIVYAATKD